MPSNADWVPLQRKIFSRWCVSKLREARDVPKIENVVEDSTPFFFRRLLESLSEKNCPYKVPAPTGVRMREIDSGNNALKFGRDCGLKMELPPQAEDIVDSNERAILGYVWCIMSRFMKFGDDDDDEETDVQQSLLMWVQNTLKAYPNIKVTNFTKSWHNGMAFCALIHKFRPKLLDINSCSPTDSKGNLQKAFDAAERYFNLEQYLTVDDIPKLDSKSMLVYVSEYYYGIAEERKRDLAANRIGKVINFTRINDVLKGEYNGGSQALRDRISKVEVVLGDRSIDNTMAGARRKLDDFYAYQKDDKLDITAGYLKMEALYNKLAMRLSDHDRPAYAPPPKLAIAGLNDSLRSLAAAEAERNQALHAELNRQLMLVDVHKQHTTVFNKMQAWVAEKKAYLNTKEQVDSSPLAQYHLSILGAYVAESAAQQSKAIPTMQGMSTILESNKYENLSAPLEEEKQFSAQCGDLSQLADHKKVILEDDLARELFKDKWRLKVDQHVQMFGTITALFQKKEAYFKQDEVTHPIEKARLQLAILENEIQDLNNMQDSMADLSKLGGEILVAKYETQHSSWVYEQPQDVQQRMDNITQYFQTLQGYSQEKQAILDQRLKDEILKEKLALEFASLAASFGVWCSNSITTLEGVSFGRTLPEVQAYKATLDSSDAEVNAEADQLQAAYKGKFQEGQQAQFIADQFTTATIASLQGVRDTVTAALQKRQARYQEELAVQVHNDNLCKTFADAAEPFVEKLLNLKDGTTKSQKPLREQLADVQAHLGGNDGAEIPAVNAKYKAVVDAGIHHNRHTLLTDQAIDIQWEDYKTFLARKAEMLEDEIKVKEMRGLTHEQYDEIKQQFGEFDKDGSGSLQRKEFRACMFSLGYEKKKTEILAMIAEFGDGTCVPYDGFKEFMIRELGDNESREEILNSWRLVNRGEEIAVDKLTAELLEDADIAFFHTEAPTVDGGRDYKTWTDIVFSR